MRPRGQNSGGARRTHWRLLATLAAAAALLVAVPASAQAFTVSGTAAPTDTTGGAHSDFNIHMAFSGGHVRDLTIGLPPGLVGDPNATPQCTMEQFNQSPSACPEASKVGSVTAVANILSLPLPITVDGDLFNVQPQPGEPARFGIVLTPPVGNQIKLPSAVQLRSDYGLNTVVNGIPETTLLPGDTTIVSQDITLFGTAPGTGRPFMRNPTSCGQKTVTFDATAWDDSTGNDEANFDVENCGSLDFSPTLSARVGGPGHTASGASTSVVTSIDQDPDEAGLLKAEVTVPSDFGPNVNLFGGACAPADFQAGNCGPSSVVGSAIAASPLLSQPLSGPVMLIATSGQLPDIGLDLNGQLHLLLRGTLDVTQKTTFDGLPDIPIAHFELTFGSSPGLLLNRRDLCAGAAPLFHADFSGYNGASTSVNPSATVDGCGLGGAGNKGKCKAKKHKRKHRAAEAKKHKKKKCKRKRRKHKKR
jgi:hypothetical protein